MDIFFQPLITKLSNIFQVIISSPNLALLTPVITIVIGWIFTDEGKRRDNRHELAKKQSTLKEARYSNLLKLSDSFYKGAKAKDGKTVEDLKNEFILELKQCWLYCSDEVIKTGYAFLDSTKTQPTNLVQEKRFSRFRKKSNDSNKKELALGAFVVAIRKDILSTKLIKRTKLKAEDFEHLAATPTEGNNQTPK